MSQQADSVKSILYALGANGAIALAKLYAAVSTGSSAMLAETIHSVADCANQGLLLLGIKRAKRPASAEHPLGHGKAVYFWSFIVALMLFSMGGLFSVKEGAHKLDAQEPLSAPWLAIGVLVFSIAAEIVSLNGCLREVNKVRGQRSLWRWFRESRQSELIVVLGEDIAALLGLVLALGAIGLTLLTGDPLFDALGSMAIGVLLILIACALAVEIKGLLIGQSVEPSLQHAIQETIAGREEVEHVLNLITLQLGADVMVAVKAKMRNVGSAPELAEAINRCESTLREAFPQVKWVFFEPDLRS
ncbi:MAG: cation diffusion facilitator family transporter [Gammaproteobacteria bacterium]